MLPAFVAGGSSLVWTWFAVAWTYGILLVPILLLPAALGRRDDPVLRAATFVGAASVLLSLIGFLRWVFVVPPLAAASSPAMPPRRRPWRRLDRPAPVRRSVARRTPGQLLAIGWSVTVSVIILRTGACPLGGLARVWSPACCT